MTSSTLHDLYIEELKELFSAQQQILQALPMMARAASDSQLVKSFTIHAEETRGHVVRLVKIFSQLDASPIGNSCESMGTLLEELVVVIAEDPNPAVMDVALIASAQRVDQYEIAGYERAFTFARLLGYEHAADLLRETLDEKRAVNEELANLAEVLANCDTASMESSAIWG